MYPKVSQRHFVDMVSSITTDLQRRHGRTRDDMSRAAAHRAHRTLYYSSTARPLPTRASAARPTALGGGTMTNKRPSQAQSVHGRLHASAMHVTVT